MKNLNYLFVYLSLSLCVCVSFSFIYLFIYFYFIISTWPPEGIDVLSLSAINSNEEESNSNWYWIHCFGTWLFSFLIYFHLLKYYRQYIHFRQLYFKSPEYQRSPHARTLIIFNVPASLQSDEKLKRWIDSMNLKFPVDQVCIGRRNDKLANYVEEYENAVRKLEIALSNCLQKGKYIYTSFFFSLQKKKKKEA